MSRETLEILRRIYEGWERGDFSVGVGEFEPNVTMVIDREIPDGGTYLGLEGIREYMGHFLSAWDSLTIAPEWMEEIGDSVLVKVVQAGTGLDSRAPVSLVYFQLWTFRGGLVVRFDSILREERAREAIAPGG